jgi:hypothetical protein
MYMTIYTDAQDCGGLNMVDRDCAVLLTVDMHFPGVKLLPGFCWVFAGFLRARTWAQVIETKGVTATG